MPCCLFLLVALLGPRVAIVLVALFTGYFERPFDGLLVPLLGFLFLPFTTLAYAWAINSYGDVAGFQALILILAVLLDIGTIGGGEVQRRTGGF